MKLSKFTRFRKKLEDAVTWGINSGKNVQSIPGSYCPLSCLPGAFVRCPTGFHVLANVEGAHALGTERDFDSFGAGFDGKPGRGRYHHLGTLYRNRFP